MAEKVLITESKLTTIGDKLRSCLVTNNLYTLAEIPSAIEDVGYKEKGDSCLDYLKYNFSLFVDEYVAENGLYINGQAVTRSKMEDYLLNRDNCKYRGKLKKYEKYIVGEDGAPAEIRGIGTHALTQYDNLHTKESLETLKYLGVNCIRMSAYLQNHNFTYSDGQSAPGYIPYPDLLKAEMDRIIGFCVELGLYVIVDWHVWSGGGEGLNTNDAVEFFTYFASRYYNVDNVLYELANEPFSDTLANIVTHCSTLRTLIKSYVTDPILITGLRSFTNGVMEMYNALQADNIDDIFLSQHRYTGGAQLSSFEDWWENDIPLFITEWSNTSASTGQQSEMNITDGDAFLNFFHTECVPHCIWKFTDQTMAYAVLGNRGTINNKHYKYGGFLENELSNYGRYMFGKLSSYAFENHIDRQGIVPGSVTYTVSKTIPYTTDSNRTTVINEQASYTNVITPDSGYKIASMTVTMGGTDISSTSITVNNGVYTVSIRSVIGNVVITSTPMSVWEKGTIAAVGTEVTNNARIRTDSYVPSNITTITCPVGMEFTVPCYDEEGHTGQDYQYRYYDFDTNTFLNIGKWFGAGTYDLTPIRNSGLPQIRLIAKDIGNTENILISDGDYFFTGGSPFEEVQTNRNDGTHTFDNGVVLTTSGNHVKLEYPNTYINNVGIANISHPDSNMSAYNSTDSINNLTTTFCNYQVGDIYKYAIKNVVTSCVTSGSSIQSNTKEQGSTTSLLSLLQTSKNSNYEDTEQTGIMNSNHIASCLFVALQTPWQYGDLDFDLVFEVVRRRT